MSDTQSIHLPLSAAQHGIWTGQQFDLQSAVYNAGECIEIRGPVEGALFEAAVRQTVNEAEALHMRFVPGPNGPVQEPALSPDWTMHRVDLQGTPDPWAAALEWMWADLSRPVDLSKGPLFTQALFQAAPDRFFWFQRVHHIAMDGFGFSLLARRVADLYSAKVSGRPAPEGFRRLGAVVEEDAAYRAGAQFTLDRTFWTERLADRPTPVTLAPPEPMSPRFVRQTRSLEAAETQQLQDIARQESLSWPDLVFAATAAWMHQKTGAPEVVLGMPAMSRLGSAALRVPCMAMNIVALRVPVRPDMNLFDVARGVAAELRAMRPHLRYRYEQLRRDLKMVGGQRRLFGPVVNIMPFDYGLRFAGLPGIAHNISAGPVEDLSIGVYARSDGSGPRIDFDANPACYSAEALDGHQRDFLHALRTLLAEPRRALAELLPSSVPVSTRPEGDAASAASLIPGDALPHAPRPVLELLAEHARTQPDAVALEHGAFRMSYRELLDAARALGDRLVAEGVSPDSPVAVMVPRSIDAIVASLGVLFAGAGYLPLDPLGPSTRTASILEDAAPSLLLTTALATEAKAEPQPPGKLLIRRTEAPARAPAPSRSEEERLAYVIYTSGSTGQPNGVQITRSALAHFVAGATLRYGMSREDRVLQFAPLHFDASVEEIFVTLCAGGRLVLRTDEMLQSVPRLLDACASAGITVLDLPTAFWHELAYSVSTGTLTLPSSLRTVIIGGEAALPERVARWRAAVGDGVQLLNTYGPTEATVVATVATLAGAGAGVVSEEVPIGLPLPGVSAVLLDKAGRPATPGTEGELYLLGGGLARGYLGRPELNAARFTVLEQLPGQPRAYRTGDTARRREDGQLVFVGRVDEEFKISGHRVDPTEVETVLLGLPGVKDAAVVGQVMASGTRRLCAHIVATEPAPAASELRKALLAALPAPMVPGAFVFSERLPRTSNGKVDRAELRRRMAAEEVTSTTDGATDLEREILGIWEQVLGVSGVSTQDDFFELGGQSLQSIQVANRLSVALGREVPVATVFRHPTAAGLAQALEHGSVTAVPVGGLTPAMLADAELPEDIVPVMAEGAKATVSQAPPRQVLLTGATGFVGTHLLDQLLRQTQARIVCPVRARDEAHAMERIRQALVGQGLATDHLSERVLALPADLTQPHLGLSTPRFHGLAAECDVIYHNAAVVSVVREYGSLKAVNVKGTRELLRLAAAVRPKPLHYVSTLAVAPASNLRPDVPEDFVPAHAGLLDGYQQSKWIAERLVQQAGERGLPVAVYRLGRVVGAPQTAIVNPQDLVWRILLAGIPAGALPQMDVHETWTPVDYVARAIVRLSLVPRPVQVFNLAPHPDVRLTDVFQWVRDYGYRTGSCPLPEWRDRLARGSGSADNSATMAFFDLRAGASDAMFGLGHIRCEQLTRTLADSDVVCPLPDRALMHRYLDYCVAHGLLPRP
ncbi:MAG: myxochelin non-ribosomal peptide synthetase MxcG [Cystobacter sp.]